jgi:hypothetical protein
MKHPTTAMVFVLSDRLLPDAQICIDYCLAQGYVMGGVIRDDWQKAVDYLYTGEAGVIIAASDETLDPDRTPRVEVVAHMPVRGRTCVPRTRVIRRDRRPHSQVEELPPPAEEE